MPAHWAGFFMGQAYRSASAWRLEPCRVRQQYLHAINVEFPDRVVELHFASQVANTNAPLGLIARVKLDSGAGVVAEDNVRGILAAENNRTVGADRCFLLNFIILNVVAAEDNGGAATEIHIDRFSQVGSQVAADVEFQQSVLAATVNGTTYCGMRARTTGAPQNHWFGPAGDPRGAGIGTPEAITVTWSGHREIIMDQGPIPDGWTTPPSI